MAPKGSKAATALKVPKAPKVPQASANGRELLVPVVADREYVDFRIARKTFGVVGGPWSEDIVAVPEANKHFAGMMAEGWEPVCITSLGLTTDGILMLWVFGKLPEGQKPRWSRIDHYVRGIGSGPNPVSPNVSVMGYEEAMRMMAGKGMRLFTVKDLGFEPSAFFLMTVWVG